MARCLIIGCGCRGIQLATGLRAAGHAVRGTTRDPGRLGELDAAGVDPVLADPDRLATLVPALDHVSVLVLLLGDASGPPELLRALHGPRLQSLLVKLIDTTVRGVVYEAHGSVGAELLGAGAERVREACERSRIPYALPGPGEALGAALRVLTMEWGMDEPAASGPPA